PYLLFARARPPPSPTPFPYTTLFRSLPKNQRTDTAHRRAGQSAGAACAVCRAVPGIGAAASCCGERFPQSCGSPGFVPARGRARSEEHTSELQSRENLVCRLLLEKKK